VSNESVILGPYAEWLVRPEEINDAFSRHPFWALVVEDCVLCNNWGKNLPPIIIKDGVRYHRFCFMPGERRPGHPIHGYSSNDMVGVQDVQEVDIKVEIDWFTKAFAEELAAIGRDLGRPPTLHWGIVGWS
jgi:hypothetical protein